MVARISVLFCIFAHTYALKVNHPDENADSPQPEEKTDSPKPELFIIRSHDPQDDMLRRMTLITEDIQKHLPHMRVVVSLDTTKFNASEAHKEFLMTLWNLEEKDVFLHTYDNSLLLQKYPALAEHSALRNKPTDRSELKHQLAWGYHAQPLALAVKEAEEHFGLTFQYIWNWEDDIVLCGNVSKFLQPHSDRSSHPDLLMVGRPNLVYGKQPEWAIPAKDRNYWFKDLVSKKFTKRYKKEQQVWGSEQVQRFSRPFFLHMDELLAKDVSAWSEMFVPTVAKNDGFTIEPFDDSFVGKFSLKSSEATKNQEEQAKLCAQVGPDEVKIHHSGKFIESGEQKHGGSLMQYHAVNKQPGPDAALQFLRDSSLKRRGSA